MRCGTLNCPSTALAATASGGATMAPSAIAAAIGSPAIFQPTKATTTVVKMTAPSASSAQRQPVAVEVAQRCVVGGIEKHRRNEQRKRQFRVDLDRRRARHEGDTDAGQSQQRRIGNLQPPRQRRQRDGDQKQDKGQFEKSHGLS